MQWSQLKIQLQALLCTKLKDRVHFHGAVYRKAHDSPRRIWITLDAEEIFSASDLTFSIQKEKEYQRIIKEKQLKSIPYNKDWKVMFESSERKRLWKASDQAEVELFQQGVFASFHVYNAFLEYVSLPIEEAMVSNQIVIRALSMFDRRLGKRRLMKIKLDESSHPLIKKFYDIRCEAEGISVSKLESRKKQPRK